MPITNSFMDLVVWQRAMDLMEACYDIAREFPRDERWGMCSQLQRAATSVASNVSEGNGRRTRGEYIHHLSIAKGSLNEVHMLLLGALRLKYVTSEQVATHMRLVALIGYMLVRLMRALEKAEEEKTRRK